METSLVLPAKPKLSIKMGQTVLGDKLSDWYASLCLFYVSTYGGGRWEPKGVPAIVESELRKLVNWGCKCVNAFDSPNARRELHGTGFPPWEIQLAKYNYFLGRCLLRRGKYDEAITEFRNAIDGDSRCLAFREDLSAVLLRVGRIEDAAAEINSIPWRVLDAADDSSAHVFLDWALNQKELASRLNARAVKQFVLLASRYCSVLEKSWRYALVAVRAEGESVEAEWSSEGLLYKGDMRLTAHPAVYDGEGRYRTVRGSRITR